MLLGKQICSYNTFSCGDWLLRLSVPTNFFLMQKMYVTMDAIIAVAVNVMMKVTKTATVTAAPMDNESESDPKQLHWPIKRHT